MFCLPKKSSATIHQEKINCQKMFRHHQRHKWQFSNQMMLPHLTATKNKSPSRKQPNYFLTCTKVALNLKKMRLNTQNNLQWFFASPEMLPKPSCRENSHFDLIFFQMGGWFNHQPGKKSCLLYSRYRKKNGSSRERLLRQFLQLQVLAFRLGGSSGLSASTDVDVVVGLGREIPLKCQ